MTNSNPSSTKREPGRHHQDGHKKAAKPRKSGAGVGFVQRVAGQQRQARRATIKLMGIRQFKLQTRDLDTYLSQAG